MFETAYVQVLMYL